MKVNIASSWEGILQNEFDKPYFEELVNFVKNEYKTQKVYPPGKLMFNAFDHCTLDNTKVVILGQDPYHGINQANGLSFSVNDGVGIPPSLRNIFKEINEDLGKSIPKSGNLERWAKQGVLLLNATLTVRANEAGSHQKVGWERFTDEVIRLISEKKTNVVFLLWGAYAQKKAELINPTKHFILKSKHPSPMAAMGGGWFGNKHFSQTNNYLKAKNLTEIDW
jgi:uracil-DNA glycosylase